MGRRRSALAGLALLALVIPAAAGRPAAPAPQQRPQPRPSLLLITLDTTRADALGGGRTPVLDALAARGTRWSGALAPAPLTLPAHASLLTGCEPPEHGLHDNGAGALPSDLPTLATLLASELDTAAIVGSRVLDRRFGLARGFALYDDRMLAERTGEYGYPERAAPEVVDRALHWLAARRGKGGFFLWVHFYDPHFPYMAEASGGASAGSAKERYRAEVALVDRQVGRLLAGLGAAAEQTLVAVAGDHGEALGEHGEDTHGVLLYRGVLEVPLFVAGPGVPRGKVIPGAVAAWRLAPTVLRLLGRKDELACGSPLPGLPAVAAGARSELGVRSETFLPQTAYGWSPLVAWTRGSWRLVRAPRPELFDLARDPGEVHNRIADERRLARALAGELARYERSLAVRQPSSVAADARLAAELAQLGYLSGASRRAGDGAPAGLDPKDGQVLLRELDAAQEALDRGDVAPARESLERLVRKSPDNVPFLTQLGRARLLAGEPDSAIAAFREAARANPVLDFPHLNLADALREVGRPAEAEAEYRAALALDPRSLRGTLGLAQLLVDGGRAPAAEGALRQALGDGLESVAVRTALARLLLSAGRFAEAEGEADRLLESAPDLAAGWLLKGEIAERRGDASEAMRRYGRAARLAPAAPEAFLAAGRLLAAQGELADARLQFQRAIAVGRGTPAGREAARRLAALPP